MHSGTGILSLFAAKSGASKVYAVEASGMAAYAESIVWDNALGHIIQVLKGRVEDVTLPEQVDVIISEWMGFYLLHEGMLGAVLHARDKWLKPGGLLYPSHAYLYLCPVSMECYCKENFGYWENIYGFDFSAVIPLAREASLSKPVITLLKNDQLLSQPQLLLDIDCYTVKPEQLQRIEKLFTFKTTKFNGTVHGMCIWFDVIFKGSDKTVVLSTAPGSPETHWKQTVLFLSKELIFDITSIDQSIESKITLFSDGQNPRHYNITLEVKNYNKPEKKEPIDSARLRLYKALGLDEKELYDILGDTNGEENMTDD